MLLSLASPNWINACKTELFADMDAKKFACGSIRGNLRENQQVACSASSIRTGPKRYAACYFDDDGPNISRSPALSCIPLEIFKLLRHLTAAKIKILAINVAIVVYLFSHVRFHKLKTQEPQSKIYVSRSQSRCP